MTLRLSIENMDRLPDGGPVRFEVKGRGLDLGRDAYLDWSLPDPNRHVSGKHCEIRFRDGGYWLHDVSTNGTFVNGAPQRLEAPYLLRNGDRLGIGPYIVAVRVEGQPISTGAAPPPYSREASAPSAEDIWSSTENAPAPDDRRAYRQEAKQARPVEFLDFAAPIHSPGPIPESFTPPPPPSDDDWLKAIPPAPRPVSPPPVPTPRRQTPPPPVHTTPPEFEAPAPAPAVSVPPPPVAPPPPPPVAPPPPPRAVPAAAPHATPAPSAMTVPPAALLPPLASAPPAPKVPPPPLEAAPSPDVATAAQFLARLAAAAGIDPRAIEGREPLALADEIGAALLITARNLAQLLHSRAETKTLMRSSSRTMIRAVDNNPFKFTSEAEEALSIIFGPRIRGYLDSRATFEQSFGDIKSHQLLVFGAIQGALDALFEDLAPEKIDRSVEQERGLGALVASRKAKLWDVYTERWRGKTKRADGRLNEAFMTLFAESYDKLLNKGG